MTKRNLKKALTKIQVALIAIIVIAAFIGIGYWYYVTVPPAGGPTKKEIKVGAVYPLSGAVTRRVIRDAIDFWVDYLINKQGGIKSLGGANVTIVWADCQSSPDLAMSETERLITQEGVVCILGSWWSSLTYATQEVCERYKVPNLNPQSSSPALLERGFQYYFMNWPNDDYFAKREVDFAIDLVSKYNLNVHTVGIIVESGLFGQTARSGWLKYLQQAKDQGLIDWEIVEDITFPSPVVDITPEIIKLKSADPDIVFACPMSPSDCVKFMTAMIEQNYYPPIMITMDAGFTMYDYWSIEEMRKGCKYFFSRFAMGCIEDQIRANPKIKEIYDLWMEHFDYWEWGVLPFYNTILTLKYALEEAGERDPNMENFPTALRDALRDIHISKEEGIIYGVDFNDIGYNELAEVCMGQNLDDPDNPGDVAWQTVWPWDIATRDPVVPDPRSRGLP